MTIFINYLFYVGYSSSQYGTGVLQLYSPLDLKMHLIISTNSSLFYSSDIDDHSSTSKNVMEQEKYLNSQVIRMRRSLEP
jgi:3-polyprenyl-4-hydroxybenzoate decarboxylase